MSVSVPFSINLYKTRDIETLNIDRWGLKKNFQIKPYASHYHQERKEEKKTQNMLRGNVKIAMIWKKISKYMRCKCNRFNHRITAESNRLIKSCLKFNNPLKRNRIMRLVSSLNFWSIFSLGPVFHSCILWFRYFHFYYSNVSQI